MALAQIGPATSFIEALATAIGAGMVIGGFLAGWAAIVRKHNRSRLEEWTLMSGYLGGAAAVLLALFDLALR